MMKYENKNGLKGQHNLAQGKRRAALGWKTAREIVRPIIFIKEKIVFRTNEMTMFFPEMMSYNSLRGFRKLNSVRKELFALVIESARTVFLLHPIPRVAPDKSGLPWAMIFWPFRPASE